MKTKLLRKVRKRFSVHWNEYKKVFYLKDKNKIIYSQPLFKYITNVVSGDTYGTHISISKDEAYNFIFDHLSYLISHEYFKYGIRRNKSTKVWYNG